MDSRCAPDVATIAGWLGDGKRLDWLNSMYQRIDGLADQRDSSGPFQHSRGKGWEGKREDGLGKERVPTTAEVG